MRIRSGLETYFWLGSPQQRLGLFSLLLLTLSAIKSRLGFNRMTNCEFLIKVLFIFVVSIVKKKKRTETALQLYSSFSRTRFKGKNPPEHLGDINQLWLHFSFADLFIFFHLEFKWVLVLVFDSFYLLLLLSDANTAAALRICLCLVKEWVYNILFSLQECLEKCGESLQEIINYHMVSPACSPDCPHMLHIQ